MMTECVELEAEAKAAAEDELKERAAAEAKREAEGVNAGGKLHRLAGAKLNHWA